MTVKYRAVLWDFDGVIFDSEEAGWRTTNMIRAKYGLQPETRETHRHRPTNHSSWYIERGIPLGPQECRQLWNEHYDNSLVGLMEGALELLHHLKEKGIPSAIVSAHSVGDIQVKLGNLGVVDHFAHVLGDAWDKKENLIDVCNRLGILPLDALFVGDLPSDVLDGRAAGVTTVLLAPPDSPHSGKAHHHISSLEQLKLLL